MKTQILNSFSRVQKRDTNIGSPNSEDSIFLESIKMLNNSIKELTQVSSAQKQPIFVKNNPANFPFVDERFESLRVDIPDCSSLNGEERKLEIEIFLGNICKKVFSIGFSSLRNEAMDGKRVKVFCSEKLLELIIRLIKKNQLTETDLKIINNCLTEKLLPYFQAKYPLSEQAANSNLSNLIIPKNNIEDQENDLFFRSRIEFKLKQSMDYSQQIMKFFNFLIEESNNQKKEFDSNMQGIFEQIYDRHKTIEMLKFNPKNSSSEKQQSFESVSKCLRQKYISNQSQKEQEKPKNVLDQQEEKRKAMEYRQRVQSFTSYRIGMKLPEHLKKYSDKDIAQGNFQLTDPALMRIATKWCEQLQKCYNEQTILNREKPYRMKDQSMRFLDKKWMAQILSQLLKKFYIKYPLAYLKQVKQHSNLSQSKYGGLQTPKQLNVYSEEEAIVGNFSIFMFQNCENYLKEYLNRLIHGIMKAMQIYTKIMEFQSQLMVKNLVKRYATDRTDQNLGNIVRQVQKRSSKKKSNDKPNDKIPSLITFKIGDLLRCKLSSKQEQIKALYCHIEKISKQNPKYLKIVRVKNRLQKGTKDILINMLYKQRIVIEMQLAIKADKSKFIESSNQFCHYLYELERAQFGPINEMCSIWTSKDQRARFFRDQFDKCNKILPFSKIFECQHKNPLVLSLPFKCNGCQYYYLDCHRSQKHFFCQKCQNKICFLCSFQAMQSKNKKKLLNIQIIKEQDSTLIYYKGQNEDQLLNNIPNQCSIVNLRDTDKKKKKIVKYKDGNRTLLLEEKENSFGLVLEYDHSKEDVKNKVNLRKFFMKNIVICDNQQSDQTLAERIKKAYIVPEYLQTCFKAEKNSISIVAENFSCSALLQKGKIKKRQYVDKINLSQNSMQSPEEVQIIINNFPKIKQLTLNYNSFQNLPENIGQLQQLEVFNMQNNVLSTLPPSFVKLTSLKILNMNQNRIYQLPQQFGNLTALAELYLYYNQIQQLPDSFGNFKKLTKLDMSSNHQLYKLPSSFGKLASLVQLNLCNNKLRQLPHQFGSLNKLSKLYLSNNKLEKLPNSIGNLFALTELYIGQNQLKQIPHQIGNLSALSKLYLSNNKLSKLPDSIGNLITLTTFDGSQNFLEQLPDSIGKMTGLIQLTLNQNNLQKFPQSIGNLINLLTINAYNNRLKQLPASIGNLNALTTLIIKYNSLKYIPFEIGNLKNLKSLQLNDNQLSQLPDQIGNLPSLSQLLLEGNQISELPQNLYSLKKKFCISLKRSDLSKNTLQRLKQKHKQGWIVCYI